MNTQIQQDNPAIPLLLRGLIAAEVITTVVTFFMIK